MQITSKVGAPELLDWTILPASVIARAWTDTDFKSALIDQPDAALHDRGWPSYKRFRVVEDVKGLRHFVLPWRKPQTLDWSVEKIVEILNYESGHDESLTYFLPVSVLARALFEPAYHSWLVTEPKAALLSLGYPLADTVVVLQNTEDLHHLVLPIAPSNTMELSFDQLNEALVEEFGVGTTKCCASGTC